MDKTNIAYKGYWLQSSMSGQWWFIQKEGFTIAQKPTLAEAKQVVDELTKG